MKAGNSGSPRSGPGWTAGLVLILVLVVGVGAAILSARDEGDVRAGGEAPAGPASSTPPSASASADMLPPVCAGDVLRVSRVLADLQAPGFSVTDGSGTLVLEDAVPPDAFSRAVIPIDVQALAEGRYVLTFDAPASSLPLTVDRTAPALVSTEPAAGTCPAERLVARLEPSSTNACGPVRCLLSIGGNIVAETEAAADRAGLACAFDTSALSAEGGSEEGGSEEGGSEEGWRLVLRDGAGNEAVHRLDWPVPQLRVDAPLRAAPGERIVASARGRPAGGTFEIGVIASEAIEPEVEEASRKEAATARIVFDAPREVQAVGIAVSYSLSPDCPAARPVPADVMILPAGEREAPRAPAPLPACGNGRIDAGEQCDAGGPSAECNPDCTLPRCGDGVVNPLAGEQCDDGNDVYGDACLPGCILACGNGRIDPGEDCDGGGETQFCNLDCTAPRCGDFIVNLAAGERCDDGNTQSGDGCSATCRPEEEFEEERVGPPPGFEGRG